MVKIYNSGNVMETQMILEMLKENGIVGVKKDIGAGGYMTIATGTSVSGADIYVSEQDAEKATALIQDMTETTESMESEEDGQDRAAGIYRRRRVFAIVMLIVVLFGILTGVFLTSF